MPNELNMSNVQLDLMSYSGMIFNIHCFPVQFLLLNPLFKNNLVLFLFIHCRFSAVESNIFCCYVCFVIQGDYHRIVNIVPKKPPLLERPGDGDYSRYDDYGHAEYRDYDEGHEGRSFAHDRRSGPPHRGVRKVSLLMCL